MDRGEIWHADLDPSAGREQRGKRYVFVVSPKSFNLITGVPIVVPITIGGNQARMQGFTVSLTGTGLQTSGVIRCDQPRAIDLSARNGRRIEKAPDYLVDDVLAKLATIFE
jgi:mRNA-degrading endonuclease toxin of MazEF toxin-antitoxin module